MTVELYPENRSTKRKKYELEIINDFIRQNQGIERRKLVAYMEVTHGVNTIRLNQLIDSLVLMVFVRQDEQGCLFPIELDERTKIVDKPIEWKV
jgi:hypothetical protein